MSLGIRDLANSICVLDCIHELIIKYSFPREISKKDSAHIMIPTANTRILVILYRIHQNQNIFIGNTIKVA